MRRRLLGRAAGLAALTLPSLRAAAAPATGPDTLRVATDALDVAYAAAGPEHGRPVVLVHDLGYDVRSFTRVAPLLAAAGLRVLAPWMRGHGGTTFRAAAAPRSAQQAALGRDLIDFIDALHVPEAVFAGFGWGAHAARAASVVRPTRCVGLVLAGLGRIDADGPQERYLYRSNLGQRALRADPRGVARMLWQRLSPAARVDAALFARAAPSFDHPDFGAILTHAWAFRHAGAPSDPAYAPLEKKFVLPHAAVPTITLTGTASGVADAPFAPAGLRRHVDVDGAGHHLPFEAPQAFAAAALELAAAGRWRS